MIERRIVGYGDVLSVAPGEKIEFKVCCHDAGQYRVDIVRLRAGDDPGGPGFTEDQIASPIAGEYPARIQRIFPGSYAEIPAHECIDHIESFTLSAVIYPTTPIKGRQSVFSRWDNESSTGYGLILDHDGSAGLILGDGKTQVVATGVPLAPARWVALAATFDAASGVATVYQRPLDASVGGEVSSSSREARADVLSLPVQARGPFLLAAWSADKRPAPGRAAGLYNGKIDAPRLLDRALDASEVHALIELTPAASFADAVVGWWDLARGIDTDTVFDGSLNAIHGQTRQGPTRGVTGHNWTGEEHNWRQAPEQYGAIHFHDDDLIDAGWETDFAYDVPPDLASGVYAARIGQGDPHGDEHVVFFVRPKRRAHYQRGAANVAFLVPTASYLAYANYRLRLKANPLFGSGAPTCVNDAYLKSHPELGASLYDLHSDWSGVHFSSRHRPLTNLRPRQNRIWGFPADMNIVAWLEHIGLGYEVITDEDLHAEGPELLGRYRAVLTGSHPEYYSTRMLDLVAAYLRDGGRWMYLGGNGFYWRIAFHPTLPGVIEVRRVEDGTRAWIAAPGEYYQSFNGEYGGLWRRIGRAPNLTVGLGFAAQGFERSTFYRRAAGADNPRAQFIFAGVPDDIIGDFGSLRGGASGEEIDRYDVRLGSPLHALVLASATDHDEAMLRTKEEFLSSVPPFRDPKIRSDLLFFECPNGGAVFSTGSIAWAASLAHKGYENNVARITANVLHRFIDATPFPGPNERERRGAVGR